MYIVTCDIEEWELANVAWYDETASCAKAGTAPPANPVQVAENNIMGGAIIYSYIQQGTIHAPHHLEQIF